MLSFVGSRAAMFSGEFSAARPVLVMSLVCGHWLLSSSVSTNSVPFDIYLSTLSMDAMDCRSEAHRFSKIVQPGACATSLVTGSE